VKYLYNYLSIVYSLKLIAALFIISIIAGNCALMKSHKVSESPSPVHMEVSYYPNGQQEYTAEYLNGKLDGISQHWSEGGSLISESEYNNGKLHGIWIKYYTNKKIMYEVQYFHGQKHGKEKWYYENGQIKSEQSFYYGNPSDTIIRWYPNGSIIY
ncbi:uncharacterized protein METZ01_LOCUS484588, partial [marine metagenome]